MLITPQFDGFIQDGIVHRPGPCAKFVPQGQPHVYDYDPHRPCTCTELPGPDWGKRPAARPEGA